MILSVLVETTKYNQTHTYPKNKILIVNMSSTFLSSKISQTRKIIN